MDHRYTKLRMTILLHYLCFLLYVPLGLLGPGIPTLGLGAARPVIPHLECNTKPNISDLRLLHYFQLYPTSHSPQLAEFRNKHLHVYSFSFKWLNYFLFACLPVSPWLPCEPCSWLCLNFSLCHASYWCLHLFHSLQSLNYNYDPIVQKYSHKPWGCSGSFRQVCICVKTFFRACNQQYK